MLLKLYSMQQFAVVMFLKTMYNIKQLSNLVLVISGNNQGLGKRYKPSLSLIYLSHKPHLIFMNIVYNLPPFSPALLCRNSRATSLFVPFSVDYLFQLMLLALILSNTDLPNMVNVSWL